MVNMCCGVWGVMLRRVLSLFLVTRERKVTRDCRWELFCPAEIEATRERITLEFRRSGIQILVNDPPADRLSWNYSLILHATPK
jgi:hypothetical protein